MIMQYLQLAYSWIEKILEIIEAIIKVFTV